MKLTDAIDALCIATKADGRSPETVEAYQRKLKPLVIFLGDVEVETVTVNDLRRYVACMMDTETLYADHPYHDEIEGKLSMHTIAGRVRAFKRLFNWLVEEGILSTTPAERIKTPRPRRREPKAISTGDFLTLLKTTAGETVADIRDRAIILCLADTGVRIGGLCGLSLGDIDFEADIMTVTEKGSKTRLVPFNPMTAEALKAWLEVRPKDQGPAIFVSVSPSAKGRLKTRGVGSMLKRRAKRANIDGPVNPHSFQHFFAREFLFDGGDLGTLADLLGHEDVSITKRWYGVFKIKEIQEKHKRHSPITNLFDDDGNCRAGDS